MGVLRNSWLRVVVLALVAASSLAVSGCGDTRKAAAQRYDDRIVPLLDRERATWAELGARLERRGAQLDSPAYYRYLEEEARPQFQALLDEVREIELELPDLAPLHERVTRYLELRVEFVQSELAALPVMQRADDSDDLFALQDAHQEAIITRDEYIRAVNETEHRVFDPRFNRLRTLWEEFHLRYFDRYLQGELDRDEVLRRIRNHVQPELDDLLRGRGFGKDEQQRALRNAIRRADTYFERLADDELQELFREVKRQALRAEELAGAAEREWQRVKSERNRLRE